MPRAADKIDRVLGKISALLDDKRLYTSSSERADLGQFQASIGSTNVSTYDYLVVDDDYSIEKCT